MNRYLYSTVRVVPNPTSGEFANIAAIAGCDETGEWGVRHIADESRLRSFCGPNAVIAAHDFLTRIEHQIDELGMMDDVDEIDDEIEVDQPAVREWEHVGEKWLQELAGSRMHSVQLSPPAPVLANSLDEAFSTFFDRVVVSPENSRFRPVTKHRILSALYKKYRAAAIPQEYVLRSSRFASGGPKSYRCPMDLVIADDRVVQMTQAWSFQVASQGQLSRDIKSWGWTMNEMRESGGHILGEEGSKWVDPNTQLQVIGIPPLSGTSDAAYNEARNVAEELGASFLNFGSESIVADRAAKLLGIEGILAAQ